VIGFVCKIVSKSDIKDLLVEEINTIDLGDICIDKCLLGEQPLPVDGFEWCNKFGDQDIITIA